MTPLYAVALGVGFVLLICWVAATAVAASVPGWEWADPEARFGASGRGLVAALTGAGMSGMSASYAGWPGWAAAIAAGAGGVALVALAAVIGHER